jgi:predicted GIY-YIG superfamily endonuclease
MFWAYMLHCRGGMFYVGHTDNLDARIGQHHSGLIKGFTSNRLPVELVWSQDFPTRYEALTAERQIKGWSRAKKMALIRGDWGEISRLAKKKDGPSTSSGRTVGVEPTPSLNTVRAEPVEALPLVCHPDTPSCALTSVEVFVENYRGAGFPSGLNLTYRMHGELGSIALPDQTSSGRADGLWQHTCFEAFVKQSVDDGYLELNFSPSSNWAAYQFDSYRKGIAPAEIDPPISWSQLSQNIYELHVTISQQSLRATLHPDAPWHIALSAVIEETDGTKSYWALKHPPGPPDFHHPDCFALTLPAPE